MRKLISSSSSGVNECHEDLREWLLAISVWADALPSLTHAQDFQVPAKLFRMRSLNSAAGIYWECPWLDVCIDFPACARAVLRDCPINGHGLLPMLCKDFALLHLGQW